MLTISVLAVRGITILDKLAGYNVGLLTVLTYFDCSSRVYRSLQDQWQGIANMWERQGHASASSRLTISSNDTIMTLITDAELKVITRNHAHNHQPVAGVCMVSEF